MTTTNNDYMDWLKKHADEQSNYLKNVNMNKATAMKDFIESMKPYQDGALNEFKKPLANILNCDPKFWEMNQTELRNYARIQLENGQYTMQQTRFGPYSNAA